MQLPGVYIYVTQFANDIKQQNNYDVLNDLPPQAVFTNSYAESNHGAA